MYAATKWAQNPDPFKTLKKIRDKEKAWSAAPTQTRSTKHIEPQILLTHGFNGEEQRLLGSAQGGA